MSLFAKCICFQKDDKPKKNEKSERKLSYITILLIEDLRKENKKGNLFKNKL